eukprot:g10646.t1
MCKLVYEPLGLQIEKICSLETCMDGNLMLSGVRCLQRVARTHDRSVGKQSRWSSFFDVNKISTGGKQRRGKGWQGSVERYICVIAKPADQGSVTLFGAFIFPPDFVFRSDEGEERSHRGRLLVYPPCSVPGNVKSKARQKEQQQFFVDFEKMSRMEQLSKVKQLLGNDSDVAEE